MSAQVTTATPADRHGVVDTIVAAFAADPAFRYFFPDQTGYAEQAAILGGHLFDRRVGRGCVWTAADAAAVSMWEPPDPSGRSNGAAALPGRPGPGNAPGHGNASGHGNAHGHGPGLAADAAARLDTFDAAVDALLPAKPHWYLGVLATRPEAVGRGYGRAVMSAGLDRAAADGLPAYLETANPRNVAFYRAAGWEIDGTVTVAALTVWVMVWRPPAGR